MTSQKNTCNFSVKGQNVIHLSMLSLIYSIDNQNNFDLAGITVGSAIITLISLLLLMLQHLSGTVEHNRDR